MTINSDLIKLVKELNVFLSSEIKKTKRDISYIDMEMDEESFEHGFLVGRKDTLKEIKNKIKELTNSL